jgi:hypothetical protein
MWEEFRVMKSMRRGAITEALNAGIDGPTIHVNNGWRKVEGGSGERKNAKIFNARKIYLSFSRFEASVETFCGHLRGGRGGVIISVIRC